MDVRSGNEAAESVRSGQATEFDTIHFLCGMEAGEGSPMQSALLLGGELVEEARITGDMVYRTCLNAHLVVLASGGKTPDEWPQGGPSSVFLRGLMYAGARAVIAPLWHMDGNAGSPLMDVLYENLRSLSAAESLRRAQLAVMKQHPHPHYWAGFRLTGTVGQ